MILRPLPQCVSCRKPISANWMLCTKLFKQPVHWTREKNASTWCGWYFGTGRIRSTVRRSSAMYLTGRQDAGMENLSGWWLQISASWNDGPKKPKRCAILIPWNGKTDSLPGFFLCGGRAGTAPGRYHVSSVGMTMLDTSCHTSGCAISIRVVALQAGYYVAQPPPSVRWRMGATIPEWRGSETRVRLICSALEREGRCLWRRITA